MSLMVTYPNMFFTSEIFRVMTGVIVCFFLGKIMQQCPVHLRKHTIPCPTCLITTDYHRANSKARERSFVASVYGKVLRSNRRRINPTAMSKPVPKSNMLPGSGVADTDSVSVEGLLLPRTSETTNRSGWPFKSPVKTTSASDGPVSASELIKMLISGVPDGGEVKAIKSLPGMTGGGLNVTPGHENPILTPSLNVAGLPKSTEDEPPNV